MSSQLSDKIITIISDKLKIDKSKISPSSNLVSDLNADSLDMVELVMALEEEFGITISDSDAGKITTVSDAVLHIEKSVESGGGAVN